MAVFDVSQSVVRQAGEIHAIISNIGNKEYKIKMGQLVIMPVLIPDFTFENWKERGTGAFGSTGR
jgi:dUTP pyrophosphatase